MFDGTVSQVEGFLCEIQNALQLQHQALVTDYDKVLYFSFYLKDRNPLAWYASIEKCHPHLLDDFNGFVAIFKEHFDDTDKHATALAKIKKLKQDADLSFDEDSKIDHFYAGLKPRVKDALIHFPRSKTLEEYIKLVTTLDNKIHQRQLEIKEETSSSRSRSSVSTANASQSSAPHSQQASVPAATSLLSNTDVVPMEVDALRRGPISAAERERRHTNHL
ncbi:hypothetical protein H0H87_005966, partial [Tephrocybe sp. NHM501043]